MTVASILKGKGRDVVSLSADTVLSKAVDELASRKIGAIVVCDSAAHVLGILSERDIVRALAGKGASCLTEPVKNYMTAEVITCGEEATVDECMEAMTKGRFRHMPIVESGKLVGIVSIGDIVKAKIAAAVEEAEAMRSYISAG